MRFTLTIIAGIGKDKDGETISPAQRELALEAIRLEMADKVGGYTEVDSIGGWRDDAGYLVQEAGKTWTLVYENASEGRAHALASTLAAYVCRALNQNSVLASVAVNHSFFITAG